MRVCRRTPRATIGPCPIAPRRVASLLPGVPVALASAVLFGASTPFAKLLVGSSDPQLLAGLLYLGAGVGLAIGQAARSVLGVRVSEAPLRRADVPWLIAIVAFGGVIGPLFLMLGLARTSAASGSLLLNLEGSGDHGDRMGRLSGERRSKTCCSARLRSLPARSCCPGRAGDTLRRRRLADRSRPASHGASTTT